MAGENQLCHKSGSNSLAYKHGGNALIYKATPQPGETLITFAWRSDADDLDICAYWNAAESLKVGFGYNLAGDYTSGDYNISYSGDETSAGGSEWVKISQRPWGGSAVSFTVRLNFYGFNSSSYPGNSCCITASQENGETKFLYDFACGTDAGSKALDTHPGVTIDFDENGYLTGISAL